MNELDKRFVIVRNGCEVSVLDTNPGYTDENLEVFGVECETEENACYLAYELEPLVRLLNEMDKELQSNDLQVP